MLDIIMLIIGISGVIAIAVNFIFEATDKLSKNHHGFAIINLYGSTALLTYSIYNQIWLFVGLNGFLVAVGLYGLNKVFKKN
jgi:hypothetical protein